MQYIWIGWLVFIVLAVIVEASTTALISIWFVPGAIISLILSLTSVPLWVQILVFVAVSAVLVLSTRKIVEKWLKSKSEPTNADAVIGQSAVVTERISNIEDSGAVKVMGKEWTARSENESTFEVGQVVTVVEIRGVKLICK